MHWLLVVEEGGQFNDMTQVFTHYRYFIVNDWIKMLDVRIQRKYPPHNIQLDFIRFRREPQPLFFVNIPSIIFTEVMKKLDCFYYSLIFTVSKVQKLWKNLIVVTIIILYSSIEKYFAGPKVTFMKFNLNAIVKI